MALSQSRTMTREPSAILAELNQLRLANQFCNAIFQCKNNEQVKAHRLLLISVSKVVHSYCTINSHEDTIYLSAENISSHSVTALLDYIYGKPLLLNVMNVDEILYLAHYLQLDNVRIMCEHLKNPQQVMPPTDVLVGPSEVKLDAAMANYAETPEYTAQKCSMNGVSVTPGVNTAPVISQTPDIKEENADYSTPEPAIQNNVNFGNMDNSFSNLVSVSENAKSSPSSSIAETPVEATSPRTRKGTAYSTRSKTSDKVSNKIPPEQPRRGRGRPRKIVKEDPVPDVEIPNNVDNDIEDDIVNDYIEDEDYVDDDSDTWVPSTKKKKVPTATLR